MALDMSSEELRAHLFRSLQGRGVLDSLKSQLRNRLATELQKSLGPSGSASPTPTPVTGSMALQVANSIVAEHLKKTRYEYSLSVFLPEAGVDSGKLFSPEELLQFMKISPPSPLHVSLLEGEKEHGFLVALVAGMVMHGSPPRVESAAVQTEGEGTSSTKPSIMARLQALDESYAGRVEEEGRRHQQSLEERLAAFQREAEARYQGQLETEMTHFRERELARVRQEERARGQEELSRERVELHHTHQQKLEAVRRMEHESLLRLRRKEQELEAGLYSQRQALLAELDALRARESELKRQAEVEQRAARVGEERIQNMAEQLAGKEKAMELVRERYQREAEEKVQRQRVESEVALQSKRAELSSWEAELGARQRELDTLREECRRVGGEVKGERAKVEELQRQLHAATNQQVSLQQHKEQLQQRLDQMSDYPHLKQRVSEAGKQLQASEQRLADMRAEHHQQSTEQLQLIKQLQRRLARPSADHLALQAELEEARKTHQREMRVAEYRDQQLRRQLASQSELCAGLQRQVEEQTVQLRAALREVEDLHYQLKHRAILTPGKRSLSQPKKVALAASRSAPRHHPPPTSHSRSPYSKDLGPDLALTDAPGQLLEETRAVFARLEQEAQELKQSYQLFQQRMVGGFVNQEPASFPPSSLPYSSPPSSSLPHLHPLLDPGLASTSSGLDKGHSATKPAISVPTTSQVVADSLFHLTPSSLLPGSLLATLSTTSLPFTSQHTQISTATPAIPTIASQPLATALSHTSHAKPPSTTALSQATTSLQATDLSSTVRQTNTPAAISAPVTQPTISLHLSPSVRQTNTPAAISAPMTQPTISLHLSSSVRQTNTSAAISTPVTQPTISLHLSPSVRQTHTTAAISAPVMSTKATPSVSAPAQHSPSVTTLAHQPLTSTYTPLSSVDWPTAPAESKHLLLLPETSPNISRTGGGSVVTATTTRSLVMISDIIPPSFSNPSSTVGSLSPAHSGPPSPTGTPPTSTIPVPVTTTPPLGRPLSQSTDMAEGYQSQATYSTADTVVSQEHSSGKPAANPMTQQCTAPVAVNSGRDAAAAAPPRLSLDDLWKVSSASGRAVEGIEEEQLDQHSPPSQPMAVSMGTISPPSRPNVEPTPVTAGMGLGQDREEVDPVMMKYMELVQQRREQQKAQDVSNSGPGKVWNPVPEGEGPVDRQLGAAEDYGLPSLSQPSEDRFSDDDNPFDDW